jgi:hypothetical protein
MIHAQQYDWKTFEKEAKQMGEYLAKTAKK